MIEPGETPETDAEAVSTIDFFGGFTTDEVDWMPGSKARDLERRLRAAEESLQSERKMAPIVSRLTADTMDQLNTELAAAQQENTRLSLGLADADRSLLLGGASMRSARTTASARAEIAAFKQQATEASIAYLTELAALKQRLERVENTLRDRIVWLKNEAYRGGRWDHLQTRADECSYLLQQLFGDAALAAEPPAGQAQEKGDE